MIEFRNCRGDKLRLHPKLTLGELYRMGIKKVWLEPVETPPRKSPRIYTHKPKQ